MEWSKKIQTPFTSCFKPFSVCFVNCYFIKVAHLFKTCIITGITISRKAADI